MTKPLAGAVDAFENSEISMPARTIYAWIMAGQRKSVTIIEVAEAMKMHRVTAALHLNALKDNNLLDRFLGPGANSSHRWRLTPEA